MGNPEQRRGPRRGPSATPDASSLRSASARPPSRPRRGGPTCAACRRRRRLLGVAALAVSAVGALTATGPQLAAASPVARRCTPAPSRGASDVSRADLMDARTAAVSRDSRRDALADAADAKLVDLAESQARQRNAALAKFAKQAEAQADKIALNQWVLPVEGYHLTATFGQSSGLWSSTHTGLDFAAPEGTPIRAIANGVVSSTGYDGSYGNKTVVTLEDGTELWFCHQSADLGHSGSRSAPARSSAPSARPATSPGRTCTSRSAPAAATRSTPTRRSGPREGWGGGVEMRCCPLAGSRVVAVLLAPRHGGLSAHRSRGCAGAPAPRPERPLGSPGLEARRRGSSHLDHRNAARVSTRSVAASQARTRSLLNDR